MSDTPVEEFWPHGTDAQAVDELAAAGIGEGDFADDHDVPPDLTDLWISLWCDGKTVAELAEWAEAVGQ